MRKLFAIALVALLLGVTIVAVIETDPGYVLVAYGNYTLEASLWIGLVLLLLLVALVFFVLRLAYQVFSGQRSLASWLGARKSRKSLRLSTQGLVSFIEGNWLTARRQLVQGARHNEAPLLNYLLAARASARLDDSDKVHEYLRSAEDAEPAAAMAVEISLAEMRLQDGEYHQAIAALNHSLANPGRHPYVLSLLAQAYEGLQDWDKLRDLLPQLQKHKLLKREDFERLERQVCLHSLDSGDAGLQQLHAMWQQVPKSLRDDAAFVEVYVRRLVECGDYAAAEKAILRVLKQEWRIPLVRLYGYVEADASRQLSRAESWLAAHPKEPQLLL